MEVAPRTIMELFALAMDRPWIKFNKPPNYEEPVALNLGAGRKMIEGAQALGIEQGWRAGEPLPSGDGVVDVIYALHFFEHLTKGEFIDTLRECERVLRSGGLLNVVVPHYAGQLAYQDLDHKSFWCEETWRNLLDNDYYDGSMPRDWKLQELWSLVMGYKFRNLVVVSQLVKV